MNKKVVIIINNLGIGGAERLVVDDVNELVRIGVDITLVTLAPEPKKNFSHAFRILSEKNICIAFKDFFDLSAWIALIKKLKSLNPDLVVTQLWFANTIGRIAARLAGVNKVVAFEQNVYDKVKTFKMFFADRVLQFISTKIIAVSEAVKRSLISHSIQAKRIDVIHNSIDLAPFLVSPDREGLRKEFGLQPQDFLFVFIGRLINQKAVDVLIESFKSVSTNSYLLIAGQGKDQEQFELQVRDGGLEKRVIFAGVQNNIPRLLLASDCFVLPSRYEGSPLVLIEALAAGTSIIVSDFEAAKEIVENEKNGLIVPRENSEALAQAMKRMRENDELRKKLGLEAKKRAQDFSIEKHVQTLLNYATAE